MDKRVQYHAGRFRQTNARAVLHRYEVRSWQMSKEELERHAFHVACWLVVLSVDESTQDHNGLSVLRLFVLYLKSLKEARWQPGDCLAGILPLVSARACSLGDDPMGRRLLRQLKDLVPSAEAYSQGKASGAVSSACEPSEAKAVHLTQKAIQRWKNLDPVSREAYVELLEREVESDGVGPRILRSAVAALSPPRCKGDDVSTGTVEAVATETPVSKDLQARLRRIVLWCLDGLDLSNPNVAPALECLRAHVQRFQELLASSRIVACQKHWNRIQAKCAAPTIADVASDPSSGMQSSTPRPSPEGIPARRGATSQKKRCKHGVRQDCRVCNAASPRGKAKPCRQRECPHGKLKSNCLKCQPCPHGKLKRNCRQCKPCPHGKVSWFCLQCRACPHGKLKRYCPQCRPCGHGKVKPGCLQCSACPHGKFKRKCAHCRKPAKRPAAQLGSSSPQENPSL